MITYPLYLVGFILDLMGIGMLVFGSVFMFAPVTSMGLGRAAISSFSIASGVPFIFLFAYGILGGFYEWGKYSCNSPQPYPVCTSIFWSTADFSVMGVLGLVLIVAGLYLRFTTRKTIVSQPTGNV